MDAYLLFKPEEASDCKRQGDCIKAHKLLNSMNFNSYENRKNKIKMETNILRFFSTIKNFFGLVFFLIRSGHGVHFYNRTLSDEKCQVKSNEKRKTATGY